MDSTKKVNIAIAVFCGIGGWFIISIIPYTNGHVESANPIVALIVAGITYNYLKNKKNNEQ